MISSGKLSATLPHYIYGKIKFLNPCFISVLLTSHYLSPAKPAAGGDSDKEDESEPQRLTDSDGPPDDANEISGGRTKTHTISMTRGCL